VSDDLSKLRTDYLGGHMTRRELLRRAAVIGLSGPALGGFLAACASGTGTTKSAAPAIGTTVLTPPAKGGKPIDRPLEAAGADREGVRPAVAKGLKQPNDKRARPPRRSCRTARRTPSCAGRPFLGHPD